MFPSFHLSHEICHLEAETLAENQEWFKEALRSSGKQLQYFQPQEPYHYRHPEDTGKPVPPFKSIWYVCGMQLVADNNAFQDTKSPKRGNPRACKRARKKQKHKEKVNS